MRSGLQLRMRLLAVGATAALYGPLQRTLIDKTGLTGTFDFTLTWTQKPAEN